MQDRQCEDAVAREVGKLPGVTSAVTDGAGGILTVTVDRPVDRGDVTAAIHRATSPTEHLSHRRQR